MATLYVENVPDDLYEALRRLAKRNRSSIAAEVVTLLQRNVPTEQELKKRREFVKRLQHLRAAESSGSGPFPTAEQMLREDRAR